MKYSTIRIIVPVHDNIDQLDQTITSIMEQDYYHKKIYISIVDFGSTDGSHDKLLNYRKERTSIYILSSTSAGRTMSAKSARVSNYLPGEKEFMIWPGDIVYPNFFKTAEEWQYRCERQGIKCPHLVSEVDVLNSQGIIKKQTPLYKRNCILRANSSDLHEYMLHGYRHPILSYGCTYSRTPVKSDLQFNQRHYFKQLALLGAYVNTLYLNTSLGCFRERTHSNELDEVLFDFDALLSLHRVGSANPDLYKIHDQYKDLSLLQQARYALWRAYVLYQKNMLKDAEDCFLISRVIYPKISEEQSWLKTETLLFHGDTTASTWLSDFYSKEETSRTPKWPVGGIFSSAMRHLRLLTTNDNIYSLDS